MSECALVLPFTDQVYDMDTASLKLLRVRLVEEQSKNHDEAVAERVTELLDAVSLEIEERALAADFEENCEKILGSFDSFLKDVGKLIEENAPDGQGARLPQIATTKKRSDTEMHELNRGRITLPPIQATHLREESPPLQAPYQGMSTSHLTGVSSHSQAVSTQAADSTHAGLAPSADYPVFYFSKKHKSRGQQKNQGDWLDYVKNTLKHTKVEAQVVCERTGFTKEKNRLEQVSQEDLDRRRVKAKAQGVAQQQLEYTKEKPFAARAETIKKYDEERRLKLAHRVAEDKNVDKEKNSKLSETADRTPAQARTANSNYTAHSTKTEPNIKNAVLRKSGSLAPSKLYSTDSHSRPAHKLEKERSGSSAVHKPVSTQRHGQLDARNQKTKQRKPEQPPSTPPASDLLPIEPSFDIRYETCAIWPEC